MVAWISEYDKDMMRGTFYPMTLNDNVNPWKDINVIVESIPELCGMRINRKSECYVAEIKHSCNQKLCLWD